MLVNGSVSSRRRHFCQQLASWLHDEDWHFTTLLAACIDVVSGLPDDADSVIHELLLQYDKKPSKESMEQFFYHNHTLCNWFILAADDPKIAKVSLQPEISAIPNHPELPHLNTVSDLASWLNVSVEQLHWLADLNRREADLPKHFRHYYYSLASKRNGGSRLIESPKSHLKGIQKKIADKLLIYSKIHSAAHGFIKNKSCKTHAVLHTGQPFVFLFDLSNCFQSIPWSKVYRVFIKLGYRPVISKYLTALCTHHCYAENRIIIELPQEQQKKLSLRHLPQGAPSSPTLSNCVLFQLDNRLYHLAKKLNLSYSRYGDDLAFSGTQQRDWSFFESLVGSICIEEGFELNYRKSRKINSHQKQRITGIVVNKKTNIDREYYDQLKATLYNCVRYGMESQNRSSHPEFELHLKGRIEYVKELNRSKGEKLQRLFEQIKCNPEVS